MCLGVVFLLSTAYVHASLIKSKSVEGGKPHGAVILIRMGWDRTGRDGVGGREGPHPAMRCFALSSSGPKHSERENTKREPCCTLMQLAKAADLIIAPQHHLLYLPMVREGALPH